MEYQVSVFEQLYKKYDSKWQACKTLDMGPSMLSYFGAGKRMLPSKYWLRVEKECLKHGVTFNIRQLLIEQDEIHRNKTKPK